MKNKVRYDMMRVQIMLCVVGFMEMDGCSVVSAGLVSTTGVCPC